MTEKHKVGIDIHGVIDTNIPFFREFIKVLAAGGFEVHILTGPSEKHAREELAAMGIEGYSRVFSITDHCERSGYPIMWDENDNPHVDPYQWDKAKASYCEMEGISLHIDDSDIYHYFFKTPYSRFYSCDTHRKQKLKV